MIGAILLESERRNRADYPDTKTIEKKKIIKKTQTRHGKTSLKKLRI